MKVRMHAEGEGVHADQDADVTPERAAWLIANGYASTTSQTKVPDVTMADDPTNPANAPTPEPAPDAEPIPEPAPKGTTSASTASNTKRATRTPQAAPKAGRNRKG